MILFADSGYVLRERATLFTASGAGWLSLKTFAGGCARYDAGGGTFAVEPGGYLVLNHGTHYTITIEAAETVASCCIFWAPAAAASMYRSLTAPDDALLSDPAAPSEVPAFVERTYLGDELSAAAARLGSALDAGAAEPACLDERLLLVFGALLRRRADVQREIAALPHVRAATRAELYRRLHLARDYADASFDRPLRLAELASVAGMSPNHLLRGFGRLFGCTPLQYLNARRIERARHLLRTTHLAVSDICLSVGFQSFASFSRTFRRRTGSSPTEYRSANTRE